MLMIHSPLHPFFFLTFTIIPHLYIYFKWYTTQCFVILSVTFCIKREDAESIRILFASIYAKVLVRCVISIELSNGFAVKLSGLFEYLLNPALYFIGFNISLLLM